MKQPHTTWTYADSSLERSFLWSLAITVLPVASAFVVSWVIARWSGPSVLGTVSWAMSFATAVLIVGKFGLDLAVSRLASEYGVKNPGVLRPLFMRAIGLRLSFTLPVAALSFVLAREIAGVFHDPGLTNPIRASALVILGASIYEFKENFLIGLNRLKTVHEIRSVHLISRVVLTCVFVGLGYGATMILTGYWLAWLIAIVAYAVLLARNLPEQDVTGPDLELRRLMVLSVTLAISGASVTIYSHMDRLMLGYFSGVAEVGQYAVARNTAEVSLFPVFAMIMMLRPALAARYASEDIDECSVIIRRSLRFSFVSGVLFAAIFAALGTPLVTFVFSDGFRYAGELMIFFIWVIAFRSIGSVILPALVAAERTRVYAWLTAISAVMNFVLNLVLIPKFQAKGAIVATIISYGFLLAVGLKEVFATYRVRVGLPGLHVAFRTILAGVLSGGLIWWLTGQRAPDWGVLVWAVALSFLYVLLIFVMRVGSPSDIRGLLVNLRK